ncbi:MAG TPA: DUF58 domain-containing protein [Dehalococcoidales bacterium]|nr:DUF58 domain-containing protein [Dehalococcoidales bacterium]
MKIRIVYFIIPLVIGLAASLTGFSLIWRLFILSLLLPLVSYLWTFFVLRNIKAESVPLPAQVKAGDTVTGSLTLINQGRIPRFMLQVEEISSIPGYVNQTTVNLLPERQMQIKSQIYIPKRGKYQAGLYTVTAGDPLCLFQTRRTFGSSQNLVAFPATLDLPFFDPLHYVSPGFRPGRNMALQTGTNVASIRDYVSGDSLRHIHWRSTAHSSKMMVKVYDPDRMQNSAKNIWVVCDMEASVQSGSDVESTEEYTITIAASLVKKFLEQGWPVGLISHAEKNYHFPLDTGIIHLDSIQAALSEMNAGGSVPVEQILINEASRFDLHALTFVITPAWNDRLVRTLLQIKKQQGVLVAILLDTGTFGVKRGLTSIPYTLQSNGVQVYVVKSGDNLNMALDSRKL